MARKLVAMASVDGIVQVEWQKSKPFIQPNRAAKTGQLRTMQEENFPGQLTASEKAEEVREGGLGGLWHQLPSLTSCSSKY